MKIVLLLFFSIHLLYGQGQTCNPDLFPKQHSKNRYWGFVNFFNQWQVIPIFTKVAPFHGNNAVVLKGTKYGVIDCKGLLVLPCKYDEIQDFVAGKAWVRIGSLWGLVNDKGKLIHSVSLTEVKQISRFTDSYWVKRDKKWGMYSLDKEKYLFKLQFDSIRVLDHNNSQAVLNGVFGIVAHDGKVTFSFGSTEMFKVAPYRLAFKSKDYWGMIDYNGNEILKPKYDSIYHKYKTLLQIEKSGKKGLVNFRGKSVTGLVYDEIAPFFGGGARVKKQGSFGFISLKGDEVIPIRYDYADRFVKMRCVVAKNAVFGIINAKNEFIVKDTFSKITPTDDYEAFITRSASSSGEQLMFINDDYEVTFSAVFDGVSVEGKNGFYHASVPEGEVLVSIEGRSTSVFRKMVRYEDGKYLVECSDLSKKGVIQYDGKEYIPCKYAQIRRVDNKGRIYFICSDSIKTDLYTEGKKLFSANLDSAWFIDSKHLLANSGGKEAIYDLKGEIISEYFDSIFYDSTSSNTWPLIGRKGKYEYLIGNRGTIETPKAHELKKLTGSFVAYRVKRKWGVIYTNGKVVIKPQFEEIEKFEKGRFTVRDNGEKRIVNKRGM